MDSKGDHEKDDLRTNIEAPPTSDEFYCARCERDILIAARDEHLDWHLAQDLQLEEETNASNSSTQQNHNSQSIPPLPYQTDKNDEEQVPNYAPPNYAPPATSSNGSRTMATRPHTNQVIEAAKLRAKDEVCSVHLAVQSTNTN